MLVCICELVGFEIEVEIVYYDIGFELLFVGVLVDKMVVVFG